MVNWPLGYFGEWLEERHGHSLVWLHKSIGLTVLVLGVGRLLWRLAHKPPPLPQAVAGWRASAARLTHAGFYVLMIALPLSGWLRVSSGKYPLRWFELFTVPKFPIAPDTAGAAAAAQAHEILAWTMLLLVTLHLFAALHHHFRLRDAVLLRMLPERRAHFR